MLFEGNAQARGVTRVRNVVRHKAHGLCGMTRHRCFKSQFEKLKTFQKQVPRRAARDWSFSDVLQTLYRFAVEHAVETAHQPCEAPPVASVGRRGYRRAGTARYSWSVRF